MDRSKQSLAVTANDPTIRAQSEPFSAAQDRLARDQIANAAESGGPVQNIEGATRMANEQAATNTGQFTSQLLSREIDSRRQEIQAALTGMQGYISDQDRMGLERELGYLNDATQRFGITTGARLHATTRIPQRPRLAIARIPPRTPHGAARTSATTISMQTSGCAPKTVAPIGTRFVAASSKDYQ
jgi:hypothetical protein